MWSVKRILVPLDGSELAERALPVAASLALKYDSEILLLRVLDAPIPVEAGSYPESHWANEALQQSHHGVQTYLDSKRHTLTAAGIPVRQLVFDTAPAEEILFAAKNEAVDLIVISSHGQGGSARWTSGSVADKVMQHSPCPVLLIREGEA